MISSPPTPASEVRRRPGSSAYLRRRSRAFTLIETMLAVLLMALLASAVALTFSRPLQTARAEDAADQIASFDAAARQAAVAAGAPVRLRFDLSADTLARFEGSDRNSPRARAQLPAGYRIDQVRIGNRSTSSGASDIDLSAHGWGRSYDVHLVGRGVDAWLCFAGLTGQMTEARDERSLPTPPPGYDAD